MSLLRSLSHRPFAWLWTGQSISRLGDSIYRIALAWWVLEETGSATTMGTVLIFSFTPMLLFLLVGGVAVDRLPRVQVMFLSDLISGSAVGLVALLAWSDRLEIGHIYVASLVLGLVEAFFFPAYTAAVPEIAPPNLLPSANSLTSLSRQAAGIAGPALAATLVSLSGTPLAFALDGLTFLISAVCLLPLLQRARSAPARDDGPHPLQDLRKGWSLVLGTPWLWITIAIFALVNVTAGGPRAVALPFLVERDLGSGVETLGLLNACIAAGSVLGAVWLGRRAQLRRRGRWAYAATAATGAFLLFFGLPLPIPAIAMAGVGHGLSLMVFSLIWTNTLQEMVPAEMLGRVSSIDALGSFVLLPIGYALAGWATDGVGASTVFAIGGVLTAALAGMGLLHPSIRGLD